MGGGAELVYINADHKLVAVGVRAKAQKLELGQGRVLFGGHPVPALPHDPTSDDSPVYLTPDGERILLPVPFQGSSLPSLTLVSNWTAVRARLFPASSASSASSQAA